MASGSADAGGGQSTIRSRAAAWPASTVERHKRKFLI